MTAERALVRELTGNLILHWFVGLDLDTDPWDHSTFSQNRKRWVTASGLLEQWFDETLAVKQKLVSMHTTLDGTPLPVNASQKSFVPIEVFGSPWTTRSGSGHWITRRTKTPAIRRSHFERSAARIRRMCRRPFPTRNWPISRTGRSRCGRHCQWVDGESPSAHFGDHYRVVPMAGIGEERRSRLDRCVSSPARAALTRWARTTGMLPSRS